MRAYASQVPATEISRSPETWWFDVSDLLSYFRSFSAPSGIQRVSLEMLKEARNSDLRVRLTSYDATKNAFVEVPWRNFQNSLAKGRSGESPQGPERRSWIERLILLFPCGARSDIAGIVKHTRSLSGATSRRLSFYLSAKKAAFAPRPLLSHPFQEADAYLDLGAFWSHSARLSELRRTSNIIVISSVYDLIPLLWPELTVDGVSAIFGDSLPATLKHSDVTLCISAATEQDVHAFAASRGLPAPQTALLRLGETHLVQHARLSDSTDPLVAGPYVLIVGTIEVRKNHALALRAWRELLRRHGKRLPRLVFAGRWGWRTDDLRAGLESSDFLDGHLEVFDEVSDQQLSALYRGARFTLFPSLYEGWGFPVSESHAHGKVCVASDSSSIPEAGRGLAVLFENDCRRSLIEAVEPLLFDDERLHQLEERIRREFVPQSWSCAWEDVRAAVEAARAGAAERRQAERAP